jgi:FkbM family methyltransferase
MRARALAKRLLFGAAPFFRGRFRYYGHVVHFPLGSHTFERACDEGIYEREVTNLILALVEPGTAYFDVGANIGLLSVPVLSVCPSVKVVSIEPGPDTLPFLLRTRLAAQRSGGWTIIGAAVAAQAGEAEFWSSGRGMGAFDGLRDTGRGGPKRAVRVAVRTLDDIWREEGCPPVSVVKIDIEGGEYQALQGARELISHARPILILEWTDKNLAAYGIKADQLLSLCGQLGYVPYACPNLMPVGTKVLLKMAMTQTETFILVPTHRERTELSAASNSRKTRNYREVSVGGHEQCQNSF